MRAVVPVLGVLFGLAFACPDARVEERPPVHAEQGSVAIGGNVSNSTIGVPYEKLEEAVRSRTKDLEDLSASEKETVALLKEKLDLNLRQVTSAREILGEADVPPERLAAKLVEIAEKFKDLQTAAAAQPGDDTKITALKARRKRRSRTASSARRTIFWPRSKKSKPKLWTSWRSTPRKPPPSAAIWP
jgi:hypothetical protein